VDDAIKQDKMKATEGMDLLDSYEKGLSHPTYLSLETPKPQNPKTPVLMYNIFIILIIL
jgi:hypothetical protein